MLIVLGLIDVVMIANLLIMVIIGGYETFVSRINMRGPPRPAGVALARQRERAQGEARDGDHRHLIDPPAQDVHRDAFVLQRAAPLFSDPGEMIMWQVLIHMAFIFSAIGLALIDRLQAPTPARAPH